MAKIAVSTPSGQGPCRGRPFTKWVVAVGMASGRPGKASPGEGMAAVLRNSMSGGSCV